MRRAVIFLLLVGYVLLSCQQISFRNSANDLGRHLRDGELILNGNSAAIFHQNYYSYAHPDAVFVNHHWLMTVVFYLTSRALGLEGLNVFYIALGVATFLLYFRIAEQEAGIAIAGALSALLMPLMTVRAGIRPEVFSMLLLGVFFTILWGVYRGSLHQGWLWLLPVLELLWVNLHPGFVLGPAVVGTFFVTEVILRRFGRPAGPWDLRTFSLVLGLTLLAGLGNPNGARGLLFPVSVSANYAMPVRENLSVFGLQGVWTSVMIEIAVGILVIGSAVAYRRGAKMEWPLLLFSASVALMTLVFFRIYVFLGSFVLVTTCVNLRSLNLGWIRDSKEHARTARDGSAPPNPAEKRRDPRHREQGRARTQSSKQGKAQTSSLALLTIVAAGLINAAIIVAMRWSDVGLGLNPHDGDFAQFMKENQIRGRVFNAYGSGGYLIHYFPDQKVYIDSRPEAYPGTFIRDEYLRPLEDEDAWRRVLQTYNFDFICFVQFNEDEGKFIVRRLTDPEWALVYSGNQILLVRRKPEFQDVIAHHEVRF